MDVVNKSTVKHFWGGALITLAAAILLYEWLAALVVVWALLAMGGIVPASRRHQKLYSTQWGVCLGLAVGIATLIFGPWNLYA